MSEEMMEAMPENQDLFELDGKKGVELTPEEQNLLVELHKQSHKSSFMWKLLGYLNMGWAAIWLIFGILMMVLSSLTKSPALILIATPFLIIGIVYALGNLILGALATSRGKVEAYFCSPAIKREPICIVSHHNNMVWPIIFLVFSILFLSPCCIVAWVIDSKTRAFVKEPQNTAMFLALEQKTLETQKY